MFKTSNFLQTLISACVFWGDSREIVVASATVFEFQSGGAAFTAQLPQRHYNESLQEFVLRRSAHDDAWRGGGISLRVLVSLTCL